MKLQKLAVTFLALLLLLGIASQTKGEISEAALLYLRIAPGARAAGMGEAYVAISDDATSTHWNPAGLASTNLSGSWQDVNVPSEYRPIKKVTAVHTRSGSSYTSFDLWMLSAKGLVRYDNKKWYDHEMFDTKTDQTVEQIIASYFNIEDEEVLKQVVARVAGNINAQSYAWLEEFADKVSANVPEDYNDKAGIEMGLDSLKACYNLCRLNWSKIFEAEKNLRDGLKDSTLNESELDRINFAVEKGRTRFIPEELKIPFSVLFDTEPTMIAGASNSLIVGTEKNSFYFNGRSWQNISLENDLGVEHIYTLASNTSNFYFGTEKGVIKFNGTDFNVLGNDGELPEGAVTAIGVNSSIDVWVVINGQLYNYDGNTWKAGRMYTTTIDDTPEKIAEKFALYKTQAEKEKFIALLKEMNDPAKFEKDEDAADAATEMVHDSTARLTDMLLKEDAAEFAGVEITAPDQALEPQTQLMVPYVAMIKGNVNAVMVNIRRQIWIGTDMGVVMFDGTKWTLPGYKSHAVTEGQTIDTLLSLYPARAWDGTKYTEVINRINDLSNGQLVAGQNVWVYKNSLALEINSFSNYGRKVYVASQHGLMQYENSSWEIVGSGRIGRNNVVDVLTPSNKAWFVSSSKILTKADGHSDISMMVAKWLPQLADDMYYFFFSGATHINGVGTIGGNITFISYGTIQRTSEDNQDLGTFEPYDITGTFSFGRAITSKWKMGMSFKVIYSHLTEIGAGIEVGEGTATAWAFDFGTMYQLTERLNIGVAWTNLGPSISYVDASQSDPLPANLAVGIAYKLINNQYYNALFTIEGNYSTVGSKNGFKDELKEVVINGGVEFAYTTIFAIRAGYIYDQEGDIKTPTVGVGLQPLDLFRFDFAYIPSSDDTPLSNTLRISLQIKI